MVVVSIFSSGIVNPFWNSFKFDSMILFVSFFVIYFQLKENDYYFIYKNSFSFTALCAIGLVALIKFSFNSLKIIWLPSNSYSLWLPILPPQFCSARLPNWMYLNIVSKSTPLVCLLSRSHWSVSSALSDLGYDYLLHICKFIVQENFKLHLG